MTHDPLCPDWWPNYQNADMNAAWWRGYHQCEQNESVIGSVSLAAIGEANAAQYAAGQRDMLAKCIEALEVMLDEDPCDCDRCRTYITAQAILRALQEKP